MVKYSEKVDKLKQRLIMLKNIIPGSISTQWNVCGTVGCKCKDKVKPKKHGPYYQLSFSVGGKSSSMFVKPNEVAEVRRRIKRYKEFKELVTELIRAYVELARNEGFKRS